MVLFQALFGVFLTCPVIKFCKAHYAAVALFGVIGLFYCYVMLQLCADHCKRQCMWCFGLSFAAFNIMASVGGFGFFINHELLVTHAPFAFYIAECAGLTFMILYPFFWEKRAEDGNEEDEDSEGWEVF